MPLCELHFGANVLRLPQMNVLVLRDLLSVESAVVVGQAIGLRRLSSGGGDRPQKAMACPTLP